MHERRVRTVELVDASVAELALRPTPLEEWSEAWTWGMLGLYADVDAIPWTVADQSGIAETSSH
jgi:hypothetical protein